MFALCLSSFLYILYDLLTGLWKTHPFIILSFSGVKLLASQVSYDYKSVC